MRNLSGFQSGHNSPVVFGTGFERYMMHTAHPPDGPGRPLFRKVEKGQLITAPHIQEDIELGSSRLVMILVSRMPNTLV